MTILDTAGTFGKPPLLDEPPLEELWVVFGVRLIPDVGHLVLDRWVYADSREQAAALALRQLLAEEHERPDSLWAYRAAEWQELTDAASVALATL